MESLGKVFNQDRAAPVRCNCKLYMAVALVPSSICTACSTTTRPPLQQHMYRYLLDPMSVASIFTRIIHALRFRALLGYNATHIHALVMNV
jgi:hypothetical protein